MFLYGKHFSSMYTGSMIGAGFGPYAVMGYVISNQQPDKTVGFQVELNPKLLAAIFGEEESTVEKAIEFLCNPDPKSRTPAEEGRRLVRLGQFAYRVVNGIAYAHLRNEEQRREQNRAAQERWRKKKKPKAAAPEAHDKSWDVACEAEAAAQEALKKKNPEPEPDFPPMLPEEKEPMWMTIAKNEKFHKEQAAQEREDAKEHMEAVGELPKEDWETLFGEAKEQGGEVV
jgi:hypothetical protein